RGGLISGLLNVPDRPNLSLKLAGDGALSDFAATLDLRTDGAPRLAGTLELQSEDNGPMAFNANMNGDVTALFLPQYAAFFGPDIQLNAQGNQTADGAFALDQFTLSTRALQLNGLAALNSDGWPTLLDITGTIADPDGSDVLLPVSGSQTLIGRTDLTIQYDAAAGDSLMGRFVVAGLRTDDVAVENMTLTLDGTLQGDVNAIGQIDTRVDVDARGLAMADPALAQAIGTALTGGLGITYVEDDPLRLTDIALSSAQWGLSGTAEIDSFSEAFETRFDTALDARDLSAFAAIAGVALEGEGTLALGGTASLGGFFDIAVAGETRNLAVGIAQADALLAGVTALDVAARRDGTGTFLDRLNLANGAVVANASANLQSNASEARFDLTLNDASLVTDTVSGPVAINGTANQIGDIWDVATTLSGPLDATADLKARISPAQIGVGLVANIPDLAPLVPQLPGAATLSAQAEQIDGDWVFDSSLTGPLASSAEVSGRFDADGLAARYALEMADIAPLAPGVEGPVALDGSVRQVSNGWQFDTKLEGPYASSGTVSGAYIASRLTSTFSLGLPNVAPLAPGMTGAATASGDVRQLDDGWAVNSDVTGPYSSTGKIAATFIASRLASTFEVAVPNVAPIVPGVSGPLSASGDVQQTSSGWALSTDVAGPYSATADVSAVLDEDGASARYAVQIPSVGALVPQLSGAAELTGTAQQVARGFDINASLQGPAGTTVSAQGLIGSDGQLALDATGQAQLGLANPFLEPRNIAGIANFDLTIDGPADLSSVSGQITTQGARLAAPTLPLSFDDISGAVRLSGGQATLDLNAGVTEGGAISITGPLTLSGRYPAQIDVALNNVVVSDPALYTSLINGGISVNGALLGGARIAGTINVGETNVQVPASGISTFGAVPDITHIGATRPVMRTRTRAGLTQTETASSDSGPSYPLDITINAPSRIFIRGRGLDAEVGGALRLTGSSTDTISTGQFDLIRGRLNILAKRFDLDEGRVQLEGRFAPYLRFVAITNTSNGTASIIIEGPADDPTVTFEATPEAPQDQVLAQIFFGRDISQLSAFQALQLANAVANLAGKGGVGLVSQLRGSFALDDLDVTSDDEGNTAVRAGKYLSDNVYTDVTVGGA
ncbi:MAG: translocation/assembly module TamB domain-containing protein, partial [Pseudomonadota bacterium]